MEQTEAVRYSPFEHVLCGFLLACILFATIFLFLQNSWGISPNSSVTNIPAKSSSSAAVVWYPAGPTHAAATSSSTAMVWYPSSSSSSSSSFASLASVSSSLATVLWYPASASSVSTVLSSSSSSQMYVSTSSSAGSLTH